MFGAPAAVEAEQQLKHCADRVVGYTERVFSSPAPNVSERNLTREALMSVGTRIFYDINDFDRDTC
ncbi:Chromate resistance protein ChrB [Nocardia wallacei]|uniref:Chromate resistance protein ChrB n=1 Tax=Nocardia wallacei TaxID=480035 RepID=UPI0024555343|nr:Chromate resistance protein ChrB [Nocardia wallacei]